MQEKFSGWLDRILQTKPLPAEVVAINFNLYEESDEDTYAVQIVGAVSFDEDDPDWACDTLYSSEEDLFLFTENDWEHALEVCSAWIITYLDTGKFSSILNNMKAVAIGFVSGDLEIIYTSKT